MRRMNVSVCLYGGRWSGQFHYGLDRLQEWANNPNNDPNMCSLGPMSKVVVHIQTRVDVKIYYA